MPSKDLSTPGPKRILALDGGGIRGAITLGFLKKIETILRKQHNNDKLVLSDYFDLIGGTSTGAIIAGMLAIGKEVDFIIDKYETLGAKIFSDKNFVVLNRIIERYKSDNLKEGLQEVFGDIKIGSDKIKTGLCIVTKRIDTASVWPIVNLPGGKYYEKNKDILLRNAVRASTAAPTFFIPEEIDVGAGEKGKFIDGGVSMFNNPGLLLFLVATLKGYSLKWKTGENELLLVSIGTGFFRPKTDIEEVRRDNLYWGITIPGSFMFDATKQNQIMLQYMSKCPTRIKIDREAGDMSEDLLTPEPLLTYLRYNVNLKKEFLDELGIGVNYDITSLRKMDNSDSENYKALVELGIKEAARSVDKNHFAEEFKIKK